MAEYKNPTYTRPAGTENPTYAHPSGVDAAGIDQGLRSYMLGIYNYMALGVALTGLVAYFVASNAAIQQAIFGSGLVWVAIFAPVALVLLLSFGINRMSAGTAQLVFWAYAALNGVALSTIFLMYTDASIARVFFISAATFGALSLYGYTTPRSLSGWGSFLFMGLVGILIAMVVNWFLQSSALQFAISVIGVLVFAGLTAYDTQRLKEMYFAADDDQTIGKKMVMGALTLYLDFINLFLMLLRLLGNRN